MRGNGHNKELIIILEAHNKIGKPGRRNSSRTTDRRSKTGMQDRHKTEIKTTITDRQGHRVQDLHKTGIRRDQRRKENKIKVLKVSVYTETFFMLLVLYF